MHSDLPDSARLWLFVTDPPGAAVDALPDVLAWLPTWTSHGRSVVAHADVLGGGALVVAAMIAEADVTAGVSGCGIDAMQHAVEGALSKAGGRLTPTLSIRYRDGDGAWAEASRPAFRRLIAAGEIHADTLVVDATLPTLGALRAAGGAVRPAADAWTGRTFGLQRTPPAIPSSQG